MSHKPCDELGANLWEAQSQWGSVLSPKVAAELLDAVSERYGTGAFGDILHAARDAPHP